MSETPNHYMGDGTITCADAMASMYEQVNNIKCERDPMTIYWWGCAFKYLWRWSVKNGVDDIDKAIDCLTKMRDRFEERGKKRLCADGTVYAYRATD